MILLMIFLALIVLSTIIHIFYNLMQPASTTKYVALLIHLVVLIFTIIVMANTGNIILVAIALFLIVANESSLLTYNAFFYNGSFIRTAAIVIHTILLVLGIIVNIIN